MTIRPPVNSSGVKTFRLEQPLDSEMQAELVRAAVKAGFQVIITETSDGPLKIETVDLAEFGVDGSICKRSGLHLLLIDETEITFVSFEESWFTPRRESWLTQDGKPPDYRLQYGTPAEINAKNQAVRRAEEAERRRLQRDKRPESSHPILRSLHAKVRRMKKDGLTHQEMCRRLATDPRPPGVKWGQLTWPEAFRSKRFQAAVRKWLTDACSP